MRITHLDKLRGIAAIMVVAFHLVNYGNIPRLSFDYGKYGWTGVQIFFVISGFILPYSLHKGNYALKDYKLFIAKRVLRIYPTYIAAIIINITLALITGRPLLPVPSIALHAVFLNKIFGLQFMVGVFWTLAIELQFYFILGLLYCNVTSNIKSVTLIALITLSSVWLDSEAYLITWFPFFGIGILIFNKNFTQMSVAIFWTSVCVLLAEISIFRGLPYALASLFALLFILYGNTNAKFPLNKTLLLLGTVSYSLYLTHSDIGQAVVNFTRRIPWLAEQGQLRIIIGGAASIVFAWLLYYLVERPSTKWSAKIKYESKS